MSTISIVLFVLSGLGIFSTAMYLYFVHTAQPDPEDEVVLERMNKETGKQKNVA